MPPAEGTVHFLIFCWLRYTALDVLSGDLLPPTDLMDVLLCSDFCPPPTTTGSR